MNVTKNVKAFALIFLLASVLAMPGRAGAANDPLYTTVHQKNKMCRDIYYLLHVGTNPSLLKDNIRRTTPDKEIFSLPQNGYPRVALLYLGQTNEAGVKYNLPTLYEALEKDHQIFGYDYFASSTMADLDMDGKPEPVYFIARRGFPDFGKLYMGENGSPLVEALDNLPAVGLMTYNNRTYVITRQMGIMGIYMLSTHGTGGQNVAEGQVKTDLMCYFAYTPVSGMPDEATGMVANPPAPPPVQ